MDQTEFNGSYISVAEDAPRQAAGGGGGDDRDARTLFVKNLPWSADDQTIAALFEGCKQVRLLTDRDTGRAKG